MRRVLVIKLGALGDFIQATAAFADIRAAQPSARITLLTTKAMMPFAKDAPWFDDIIIDERKPFWNLLYLKRIKEKLRGFDMVYDLQTNQRTSFYYKLSDKPGWNGVAEGCSHPQKNPARNSMHSLDRIADQLKDAGIESTHKPNISYAAEDCSDIMREYDLTNFVALIPGGSAHRPGKRWPHFKELITELQTRGFKTVLIGGPDESMLLNKLANDTHSVNLCGKTNLNQLIALLPQATYVIGNDTGPMQLAAACDSRGAVIFGSESNPKLCAPRNMNIHILEHHNIAAISSQQILDVLKL